MFIRDLPTHGKTMMIHLDVPRLICLACRKTFMAVVAEVDADHSMTSLVRWMGRQSIEYTYAEVAKQVGVDEKTVRNIFVPTWPIWKSSSSARPLFGWASTKSNWAVSVPSSRTSTGRTLIDMLPDRYSTSIERFMNSLPNKGKLPMLLTCGVSVSASAQRVLPRR